MVVPMEQWASQPFQDKSADLWVVMLFDHNEKYSDRMERFYKAFAVTFELRFPFPLRSVLAEKTRSRIFLFANFTIICLFLPGAFCPSRCDTAMSVGCTGGVDFDGTAYIQDKLVSVIMSLILR